jgi:CRP-like cAMP-binding protein
MDDPLRNKLLAHLSLEDRNSIIGASSFITLDQGEVVQKEGRNVAAIFFPLSGMLSLLVALKGGRTVETCVVGREGMSGARAGLGSHTSRVRVVAQLPVHALTIPAEDFRKLVASSTPMAELCLRNIDVLLDQTRITAACNAFHAVEERFCS